MGFVVWIIFILTIDDSKIDFHPEKINQNDFEEVI